VSAPDNNLKHPSEAAAIGAQIARAAAWVSGIFSLVACIFLIMQQVQSMVDDPLNDPTLKVMRAQIAKDQSNQQLRDSVRALHLMTRRAFFTNQELMRATGLLTLFGVAIFLASAKTYVELRLRLPVPQGQAPREGGAAERSAGRWAVAAGAGLIVVVTLTSVFLSPPDFNLLGPKPAEGAVGAAAAPAPPEAPSKAEPTAAAPAKAEAPKPAPAPAPAAEAAVKIEPPPLGAWPAFRGPGGNGVAAHAKAPLTWNGQTGENILWKVPVPKTGTNSPIVWGDKVFVAGADDQTRDVYAYDAKTGKLLWTAPTGLVSGTLPKVMEGTTFAASTLTTDGERVYAVFATGDLVAFAAADGKKVWGRNLGAFKNSYGHSSSLILYGGRLLVQFDHEAGGHLMGFDARTGNPVWDEKREVKQSSWASPIVVNTGSRTEAILSAKPFVMSHDPLSGKLLWKVECMDGEIAPSPAYAAGRVFLANEGAAAIALQLGPEPKVLWKYEENLPDVSSPVATEKYVLMAASGGTVTCLDAATGKKIWAQEFDDGFYASPVIVGDRVYLMDKKGVTVVFRLGDQYEKLALNPLGEKATCTPAIPEGRIYFRSEKNLYCVGKDGP
jgi:outer membrane protein assembly factor BamB